MRKIICLSTACILFSPISLIAKEGFMCTNYYENVERKANNIKSYGSSLSQMAKNKLLKDLKFDTEQCISECEGEKFKQCNEVAKWILE